jgi:ribose 1,5-bisphosphokinase PhnN
MGPGRLVKVTKPSSSATDSMIAYVVSEENAVDAVNIIKREIAQSTDEVVAVSRVSEELLKALSIPPGEFKRADGHRSKGNF